MSEQQLPEDFNREAATALAKLVNAVVTQPGLRQAFRTKPVETATAAGVDITPIPETVIGTLASLSVQELRLLSELNATMADEGLHISLGGESLFVL
jgi:hypothetical protein